MKLVRDASIKAPGTTRAKPQVEASSIHKYIKFLRNVFDVYQCFANAPVLLNICVVSHVLSSPRRPIHLFIFGTKIYLLLVLCCQT